MRLSIEPGQVEMGARNPGDSGFSMVPTEGVEPTHPHGYQILSLARLPIPPHRPPKRSSTCSHSARAASPRNIQQGDEPAQVPNSEGGILILIRNRNLNQQNQG